VALSEINCEEVLEQVDLYLTAELPSEEIENIAVHLEECGSCDDRVEVHVRLRRLIATKCGQEAPPHSLLKRIRSLLEQESPPGA
jgi:mycothiol system anti-sigma-R factor